MPAKLSHASVTRHLFKIQILGPVKSPKGIAHALHAGGLASIPVIAWSPEYAELGLAFEYHSLDVTQTPKICECLCVYIYISIYIYVYVYTYIMSSNK